MFTRKKITVPASGESENFFLEGLAIIVESMAVYSSPEQVPLLSFGDRSGSPQPLYPQSVYVDGKGFERFSVTGTEESAGDTIFLLATDQCLSEEININTSRDKRATLKATFGKTVDDTVNSFSELELIDSDGNLPTAMYISVRSAPVTYAFDTDPVQGAGGLGHVLPNGQDPVKIEGINFIKAFRFRARTALDTATLSVTLEY